MVAAAAAPGDGERRPLGSGGGVGWSGGSAPRAAGRRGAASPHALGGLGGAGGCQRWVCVAGGRSGLCLPPLQSRAGAPPAPSWVHGAAGTGAGGDTHGTAAVRMKA